MRRFRSWLGSALILCVTFATFAKATEVLQLVPRDALGLAVVRNLSEADAKVGKVLSQFGSRLPGPLALLKSIAGLDAGLDERRDVLLVLLPPQSNSRQFHLAIWLPVQDYDALVRSLDGDPERRVAAVTLAGEDLLVVRQGDWAVVMDPEQRDRLEGLRGSATTVPPQQLAEWTEWIDSNDATLIALPAGMRSLWAFAASEKLFEAPAASPPPQIAEGGDLFGPAQQQAGISANWPVLRDWVRTTFADSPELARWAADAEGVACGVRLDDAGNAVVGVRLEFSPDGIQPVSNELANDARDDLPRMFDGGEFVITGSGRISPQWAVPAVAPYVRQMTNDLATTYGNKLSEDDAAKFRKVVESAVSEVQMFSVLTRPGVAPDGVFTNNFLALRVDSSEAFLTRVNEAMQLWNAMVDKSKGGIRLVFKSKPITVAGRQGSEHSIDMATAVAGPAIPELKTSMEKLFGPGGEFRLQFVPIDDTTVLLAAATEVQVTNVIEVMSVKADNATVPSELRDVASLSAKDADWQLFASPSGYSNWLARQMDAVLGPVIGGPVVPQFPHSPPVGLAGGVEGTVVWAELAVPAETIHGLGKYIRQ